MTAGLSSPSFSDDEVRRGSVIFPDESLDPTKSYTSTSSHDQEDVRSAPPSEKHNSGWKPVTLHPVPLISIAMVTSALIAVLSYLEHLDAVQGGLAFASSEDGLSSLATFGYLYLPTVISVLLSMLWAWIDLDMKRLEPFFQMSRSGGVAAEQSILLQYPFDFIAWAPIKAAKRRHWGVCTGGMVTVIIFWAITPLQGAVFDTRTVLKTDECLFSSNHSVADLASYNTQDLSAQFLERVWNIIWYNASLPAFTTRTGAILPIEPTKAVTDPSLNLLTANSIMLTTTLDCEAPSSIRAGSDGYWKLNSTEGCEIGSNIAASYGTLFQYFGWADDTRIDYTTSEFCDRNEIGNKFLGVVGKRYADPASGGAPVFNLTAQFCQPKYWSQSVEASLIWPSMAVNETRATGPLLPLDENLLNTTYFESIISAGGSPSQDSFVLANQSAPATSFIVEWSQLDGFNLTDMPTNMPGFILGTSGVQPGQIDTLVNSQTLVSSLEKTHQILFAVAASDMLKHLRSSTPTSFQGKSAGSLAAVRIIQPFGYIMQGFLTVTALCSLFLALFYWQRPSNMIGDPDSLRRVGTLKYILVDTSQQKAIQEARSGDQFELSWYGSVNFIGVSNRTRSVKSESQVRPTSIPIESRENEINPTAERMRPFYLEPIVGAVFGLIIVGVFTTLITLQQRSVKLNGLAIPWTSSITQQIVLNYLPTLVATLLEPAWTLLNRMLCLLQPFEELHGLKAKPSTSIDSRYTSLPPQLTILRALRGRHFVLALVCCVVISANVLAVSMNALFNIVETEFHFDTNLEFEQQNLFANVSSLGGLTQAALSQFTNNINSQYQDHFYLADMNYTQSASLPPWTGSEYFMLPLQLPYQENVTKYVISDSPGVAVSTDCKDLGMPFGPAFQLDAVNSGLTQSGLPGAVLRATLLVETFDGRSVNCTQSFSLGSHADISTAIEVVSQLNGTDAYCGQHMLAIFARNLNFPRSRIGANVSKILPFDAIKGSSQTFVLCRNTMKTMSCAAEVDTSGQIIRSAPENGTGSDSPQLFASSHDAAALASKITELSCWTSKELGNLDLPQVVGHTTATSSLWLPYLMASYANSSDIVDPTKPAPTFDEVAPMIQAAMAQLGALLISLQRTIVLPHPAPPGATIEAAYVTIVPRLFFDRVMFPITIALLAFNLIVGVVFFVRAPKKLLTEMPTTIHAQRKLFIGSSVSSRQDEDTSNERFGYGRFLGIDGKLHVGIERVPYVQPLFQEGHKAME